MSRFIPVVPIVCALLLVACRTSAVYNPGPEELGAPASATLSQVTSAIREAGAGLGWQMIKQNDGIIKGKLFLRTHVAVVDIIYNTKAFSITYVDSTNLNYDGTNIHSNYNSWVRNLSAAIKARASSI